MMGKSIAVPAFLGPVLMAVGAVTTISALIGREEYQTGTDGKVLTDEQGSPVTTRRRNWGDAALGVLNMATGASLTLHAIRQDAERADALGRIERSLGQLHQRLDGTQNGLGQ